MTMAEIVERFICIPSTVAVVGASPREDRSVFGVMAYLREVGFHLYPVNPVYSGETIQSMSCVGTLGALPGPVDIVALFLAASHQGPVLEDLRQLPYRPIVWFQPGAENPAEERRLVADGYSVVPNACMMMIHQVYGA